MSETETEVAALRSALQRVEALADEWERRAGDRTERPKSRIDLHEAADHLRASVGSSGEAESGGVWGTCDSCGRLADLQWSVEHTASFCSACYHRENPAPASVPSGGQADGEGAIPARIERRLAAYEESPIGNRCVTCGHVRHNELAYCQTGSCDCEDGTTVANLAKIIRRDLPAARPVLSREALRARLDGHWPHVDKKFYKRCTCGGSLGTGMHAFQDHLADVLTAGGGQ